MGTARRHVQGSRLRGSIFFLNHDLWPTAFDLTTRSKDTLPAPALVRFLQLAAVRFDAVFGLLHQETRRHGYSEISLSIHTLRRGIGDLYWATVLGEPYVRLIGKDKVATAPVREVEFLDNGAAFLQLTPESCRSVI